MSVAEVGNESVLSSFEIEQKNELNIKTNGAVEKLFSAMNELCDVSINLALLSTLCVIAQGAEAFKEIPLELRERLAQNIIKCATLWKIQFGSLDLTLTSIEKVGYVAKYLDDQLEMIKLFVEVTIEVAPYLNPEALSNGLDTALTLKNRVQKILGEYVDQMTNISSEEIQKFKDIVIKKRSPQMDTFVKLSWDTHIAGRRLTTVAS